MPVYEYECGKGHRYEKTESFGAPAEQSCAKLRCRSRAHRVLTAPRVHFVGSGWSSGAAPPPKPRSDGDSGSSNPIKSLDEQAEGDMTDLPLYKD